jgi:hypothetical protein
VEHLKRSSSSKKSQFGFFRMDCEGLSVRFPPGHVNKRRGRGRGVRSPQKHRFLLRFDSSGWKRAASRMANARQPICIMSLIYFSARLGAAERRKNPFRGMLMSKSARRFIPLININNTLGSFDTCVSRR